MIKRAIVIPCIFAQLRRNCFKLAASLQPPRPVKQDAVLVLLVGRPHDQHCSSIVTVS